MIWWDAGLVISTVTEILYCSIEQWEIRRFKDGATNTEVFLRGLWLWGEKQILARAIEIQKENWGQPRIFFLEINEQQLF